DLYARPAAEQRRANGVLAARDPEVGLRAAGVWIGSNLSGRDANVVHKVHAPGWLLRADPTRRHGAGADRGACRRGLGGRRAGALASWQVGSLREALAARDAGCDFIIAQGIEAGGHIRGKIGVLALLSEVLDAVDIPVLAAGGIGSGRSLAAVLAAGAAGARV